MTFSIIVTIIAFGIMVILHEAGHMLTAKRIGVSVQEFSVGMGPLLFKWGKGETQYSLRLLPLGGYVKLDDEEESDNPRAYSNASPLKKIGVLVSGAAMNVLLGLLCFVIINNVSPYRNVPIVSEIMDGYPAQTAGMEVGDRIVKLDGTRVHTHEDIKLFMLDGKKEIKVTYVRDGEKKTADVVLGDDLLIGFRPDIKKLNFAETLEYSYYDTKYVVKVVFASLKMLFTGEAKVSDLSGPVGIVQIVDDTVDYVEEAEGGMAVLILNMLSLFGMISVNLGVFNLLPFPGLDGGSIIFAFSELVTRKKLKPEILGYINMAGLALLLGLGAYVMFMDILKLF